MENHDVSDAEWQRSLSRMIYGHEIWLEMAPSENNEIAIYGLYGHKMAPDNPMPTDYANVVLYDDNGRCTDPEKELVEQPRGWKFSFEDKGAKVYTFYVDSNSIWVKNDEGWHRGTKRDFASVQYSGAFNVVAKRIVSRDGIEPGSVIHSALEILPSEATLKIGTDAKFKVLYEGNPLKNVKMKCFCKTTETLEELSTDDDGILTYPVRTEGEHMFIARFTDVNKKVSEEFDETGFVTTITMGTR